uniref:ANK_REP_REGION domain-containing protein n=1 Tax=Macrostomum lignano TaxID=282301 RepID=A0A1I8FEW6_9PLAT
RSEPPSWGHSAGPNSTASCCFARGQRLQQSGTSLAAFGSLEAVEPFGYTPMHAACQTGKWSNVAYLIQEMIQPPPPSVCAGLGYQKSVSLVTYKQFNILPDCMKTGSNICTESADMSCSDAEATKLKRQLSRSSGPWPPWQPQRRLLLATTPAETRVLGCVQARPPGRVGSAAAGSDSRGSGSDDSSGLGLALQVC